MRTSCGGVAEWLKAAVLKTVNVHAFVGSNPTASASIQCARQPTAPGAFQFLHQAQYITRTDMAFEKRLYFERASYRSLMAT